MESAGAWSSDKFQWLDLKIGHAQSSPSNGHQDDFPYYTWDDLIITMRLKLNQNGVWTRHKYNTSPHYKHVSLPGLSLIKVQPITLFATILSDPK